MMSGVREHIRKYVRQYIQLITAVLYNCHLTGFIDGRIYKGSMKGICVPGLNCYSCPGAVGSCPLGSLQGALAKSAYKLPYYMLGTILLFGILFGRMICGFFCPFGAFQELLFWIPLPKLQKSRITRSLSYVKYGILIVFVVIIPVARLAPGFCKYICPAGTLEAGIPLVAMNKHLQAMAGRLFSWKVFVLVLCLFFCAVCYRAFCRFFCPLGALYSFFNLVAFFGIKVNPDQCTGCQACLHACRMDVKSVGDHECIHCGACRKVCKLEAISYGRNRASGKLAKGTEALQDDRGAD